MHRVQIIHWRLAEAGPLVESVRRAGFAAMYCGDPRGPAITQAIRENMPEAVVIDLSRLPSHGKEVAVWLRGRKATRHVPVVFVGGDAVKVQKLQKLLPDAFFTVQTRLPSVLKSCLKPRRAGAAPPTALPAAPPPMMQRYQNRTAAQKMGVREGTKVAVMNPPRDYPAVLGELPAGAELIEEPVAVHDVTLWFVHQPEAYLAALPDMRTIAARTKLWVIWRKGSTNGVTQNFVRETAIDAGLVDYKICSVDGDWSGIAFARGKK